jgi:predicted dehydrogenase
MKRVGIVGVGVIGEWHAARWGQLPVELVGFYDIQREAAQAVQQKYGGRVFASLEELLGDVDIVDVCVLTTAHKAVVLAAAAAGKAIVCEKPLARRLADGEEMVAACEAAGVPLFVAQVVRFFPQFARAKAVLDEGSLGKPAVLRTIRAGSVPYGGRKTWFMDFEQSGGVMMDVGVHDIDYARWCFGEVARVFARGLMVPGERDHALITLRFVSGAIGHIETSWSHPPGSFRTRIEMAGDKGLLEWDSLNDQPLQSFLVKDGGPDIGRASPLAPEDDPYYRELAHFLDCLEHNQPFLVSPRDGLMAVKIALAAIESRRRGEPVDIATFEEVTK